MEKRAQVGVGVIVVKGDKVLLGKRKDAHGNGTWSFPGGHLEFGEELEDCATREVAEETGIEIKNIRFAAVTNDIFPEEGMHYITVYMLCDHKSKEPAVMEPNKCEAWEWFEWDALPSPLFIPVKNLLKSGYNPLQ